MYENYLVTVQIAMSYGYKIEEVRRSMTFLINEERDSVLAFGWHEGKKVIVRLSLNVYRKIKGYSICFKKNDPMPYVQIGSKNIYLHRIETYVPEGMQCDHIDSNRLNCVPENIRFVTNTQNSWNKFCTIKKVEGHHHDYTYKISVSASDVEKILKLSGKGFRELNLRKDKTNMSVSIFQYA